MLKELLPPILVKYLSSFFYGWTGNYLSWEAAQKKCSGYDSEIIFNKVKNALLKVKNGEHFVKEGKQTFADENLKFYYTIDECLNEQKINLFLLGSVLQYIEKPYELLDIILSKKITFIHLDRTPIFKNNGDRITIQKVHKSIYDAQYPCWIFNETKLINYICNSGYELVFDAEPNERINVTDAYLKGYYFKLKQ